jgi:acetyl-CoA carboxylase biotin carboxyl carrier protein
MTIDEIRELIQLVVDTGVGELEVQRGDNKVRIRRSFVTTADVLVPQLVAPVAAPAAHAGQPHALAASASAQSEHAAVAQSSSQAAAAATSPDTVIIKSPIVGTYYDSASPGSAPFVKVGDAVEPGQVLCIIESMKLMNEIEAEVAGTIINKLTENGRPVEYGEALFALRPR